MNIRSLPMPKKIQLTQKRYALVDDDDYDWINQWKWQARKISHTINHELYYAARTNYIERMNGTKKEKYYLMHRLIIGAKKGEIVDHINRNPLDNRKSNLRIVTHRQNMQNRIQKTSSKYPGVYFDKTKNRWRANITINKKRIHLGHYINEYDAYLSYSKACEYIENDEIYKIHEMNLRRRKQNQRV